MVARELLSGQTFRLSNDELRARVEAPFPTGPDSLFVAYYASAELGCFLALGWPPPKRIVDLYAEFRCQTSGLPVPCGNGMLGALAGHGLDCISVAEKDEMRQLAIRGGPFTLSERQALLDYCEADVTSLSKLWSVMLPRIDLPRALLRGRYMLAAARMERNGVPIDTEMLKEIRTHWPGIQNALIEQIDSQYRLTDGKGLYNGRTFKADRFAAWLAGADIPWPRLPSGRLALDDDTFRAMSKTHPAVAPLRELRHALSDLRLESLAVGSDGRNRCLLSAFASKTSRNQPSNAKFIFGPSVWLRGLIRPEPGTGVAYLDFEQQEFAIGAALSHDASMMSAYKSGDPYLEFAKQARAAPPNATKATHQAVREQFKVCALGVQYGMGERSLAERLNESQAHARALLQLHRQTYPRYWEWIQAAVDHAMLYGWLQTVFGWRVHVGLDPNPRSLANFCVQGNGAEMLRLACCLATEQGIKVCAPIHDALLVEARIGEIDEAVARCQQAMAEASRIVLGGFELRTDAKIVRFPDRYMDPRGERMWKIVTELLVAARNADSTAASVPSVVHPTCTTNGTPPVSAVVHPSRLISISSS
jgi:hypothetical protein